MAVERVDNLPMHFRPAGREIDAAHRHTKTFGQGLD
jgi:hypothetical protein